MTATNSLISHNGNRPKFNINPNQNYRGIKIGIRARNNCGCSDWKWKGFTVQGGNKGDPGGSLVPE